MRLILLGLVLGGLTGCASHRTVTDFPNLGFTVIQADSLTVNEECNPSVKDDGTMWMRHDSAKGCAKHGTQEIYLDEFTQDVTLLLHEICHLDRSRSKAECARLF